jgi:hypothetical protein
MIKANQINRTYTVTFMDSTYSYEKWDFLWKIYIEFCMTLYCAFSNIFKGFPVV